jgi:hypothetical protein
MGASIPTNTIIALAALCVSLVALIFTARTHFFKVGQKLRCNFAVRSGGKTHDTRISAIVLENLKDRAIVVFKIYLRIGYNYFIELEDRTEDPIIIKPYEAYYKSYDPIVGYSVSLKRIKLNQLFSDTSVDKTIVLSTSNGRYNVETHIRRWDAIADFFQNYATTVIQPLRFGYKDKIYGEDTKFLVEIKPEHGPEEIVPLREFDYQIRVFKGFMLTAESLSTKENLEKLLNEKKEKGLLDCTEFKVVDFQREAADFYEFEQHKTIEAKPYGWFRYYVLGRVVTYFEDRRLRSLNRKRNKMNAAEADAPSNKSLKPTP